uniref:Uncharacterized protein n=1 Tax=Entomoneis paludosa TaxID=265537 RepID=A0A7S2YT41_9STRA|mmetsp:Transcript_8665/g.18009  ORF Transcript_8665/g.18009 Transcript_8665/m.18009 type:complete len:404 (+) Transcript_8665:103-1314(+)|eukprot:CAMPEP_0172442884 /NCGR_PEP_ID=MMETSP1065-20121228/3249_1 /TAXON_ID=265537 /ORGANISM="Amphiprora paludosa, Strain CCMP125" /LENGTH=403 /DNA_ID=CAMNT_0013192929 /DNA_START=19 /DNA_END=1230 /DNA_ORIENTATION=-
MKAIKSSYVRPKRSQSQLALSKSSQRLAMGAICLLVGGSMMGLNGVMNQAQTRTTGMLRSLSRKLQDYTVQDIDSNPDVYTPAMVEQYLYDHRVELGYEPEDDSGTSEGCKIWNDPHESTIYDELQQYREEIVNYWEDVKKYNWIQENGITDVRPHLHQGICQNLELDPRGRNIKDAYFSKSNQLSRTNSSGWIEPLLTPMRHPNFCTRKSGNILNTEYLVHDFRAMCEKLKPTSRIVLFDMGASPKFAGASNPMWKIMNLFGQFGFKFDHIYAYEIKHFDPQEVYQLVPRHLQPAYHWINAGVSIEEGHALNPFTMLEQEYNEDDLVIVKLDIDTASLEVPLAHQLLNSPKLWNLVDQFYFEHHVRQEENRFWAKSWGGSIKDTLDLFFGLRKRGVPAHFWV